jgi:hypothetical protein
VKPTSHDFVSWRFFGRRHLGARRASSILV